MSVFLQFAAGSGTGPQSATESNPLDAPRPRPACRSRRLSVKEGGAPCRRAPRRAHARKMEHSYRPPGQLLGAGTFL